MIVSILLIMLGLAGIGMGAMMFGDIGVAAMIGGGAALLSGFGFIRLSSQVKALKHPGPPTS